MTYVARRTEGEGPLAFTFHGTGGTEDQFHGFAEELFPGASVVSPRGDVSEFGAARFFRRTGEGVYDMDDLARATAQMGDFIANESARLTPTATLGFGYSNGANILASVSFARPELFDRIALLHPLIPFDPAPQPGLAGCGVLITAGERDPICPPDQTRALAAYYADQGAEVELVWHGGGHEIARNEIDALAAFFATAPA
ncbi:MAG: alpha/beta hydrolase [Pseudomonadota bacterium]